MNGPGGMAACPARTTETTAPPVTAESPPAHHSCAVIEADERGLAGALVRDFAPPPQDLAEALTFCDMTTSPDGEQVHVTRRLAEIHDRYGSGHLVSGSIRRATPLILQAVVHVHARNP